MVAQGAGELVATGRGQGQRCLGGPVEQVTWGSPGDMHGDIRWGEGELVGGCGGGTVAEMEARCGKWESG
ncbi:hypothetical protein GUJ93_ZPchr0013g33883 [Zizania palustris]|uniref:Uncharacterized protein n=1 Tax=Zizania palustris TaxID=103762 RepID=A0A8J5WVA2_ZIZPA|nr:hypothetical protein GUJ93_ZPchr0013g33883 [Zizania palustris]